jgi:DNA/RNA-binding protein KIN17
MIANRIKAKGLTKLRWYCQLCEKACRDENGYKCHTQSESHLRQVRVFAESPEAFVEFYRCSVLCMHSCSECHE